MMQIAVLVISIVELFGVTSIAPFMAVLTDPEIIQRNKALTWAYQITGAENSTQFLSFLGYTVLVLIISGNLMSLVMKWYMTNYGQDLGRDLGIKLFRNYLGKSYLFHTNKNSSVLTNNIVLEVTRLTNNVVINYLTMNSKFLSIVFIASGLLYVDLFSTIIIGTVFGGGFVFIYLMIKRQLAFNNRRMTQLSNTRFKIIGEGLGGIKELKLHNKENVYIDSYTDVISEYAKLTTYNMIYPVLPRYFLEILAFGGVVTAILYFLKTGQTIADFLPILSLYAVAGMKLLPAFQQVFTSFTIIKSNTHSLDVIFDDISDEEEIEKIDSDKVVHLENELSIKKLCFSYPNSESVVLKNINCDIEANTSVAFVGFSGSGKSTLVDCILGLLQPESGSIKVDGQDILKNDSLKKWQMGIGYVPQTIYLLDSSIAQNIAFCLSDDQLDMEKVKNAAKLAKLDEFIEQTTDKYQTVVGERGVQLSGGQRQRIGIARALYNNPGVIIFDEATSSLDNITENEIMDAIYGLSGKKTIIMIAHRLSTVKKCDQLYMMGEGRILSSGTYSELEKNDEYFQKLLGNRS